MLIDSNSTDRTPQIAENLGAKVVQVDFEGFGKIRMAGIEHTTNDWILSIDADERCTPEAKKEVLNTINSPEPADAYFIQEGTSLWVRKSSFADGIQIIANHSF